jgi:S1-C subfamily serine protease
LFIPGRGIGIQEVEPGSPAELAGLTPGMVILQADGIGLTNDDVMSSIIEGSDGLLNLTVISDADENLFDVEVQMEQIVENDF